MNQLFPAVLEVGDGVFEVLSTSGDTHLGGDDFDKVYSSSSIILGKLPRILNFVKVHNALFWSLYFFIDVVDVMLSHPPISWSNVSVLQGIRKEHIIMNYSRQLFFFSGSLQYEERYSMNWHTVHHNYSLYPYLGGTHCFQGQLWPSIWATKYGLYVTEFKPLNSY